VYGQHVQGCGNLANSVGPFDYYDRDARPALSNVETNHFTPDVEALRTGKTDVRIIGDIDFVLRHFPNHPRALNAVATYALRGGQFRKDGIPSADCYFRRALVIRPEDATVRMLYANYLTRRGSIERAMEQYEEALRLAPESPEVNYNAGLFFVGQGDIERAKQLASAAYAGGYPLPGLRRKIESAEATQVK
jgi:tetratricopeptide (TPR) repeat protein